MGARIGIRLEDKNVWERRTPLVPDHVAVLRDEFDIEVWVQSSPIRAFSAEAYTAAGARIVDDLSSCSVIFAVKEIPRDLLKPDTTYIFFSHTIKGQAHNMPMLERLLDLRCTLIDYEKIVDENGRRRVFFGKYAGVAGMVDTLWALGQRLAWEGWQTPFARVRQTIHYADLAEARDAIRDVGRRIADEGLPASLTPLICGFAGYGNVSSGAQSIYDLLPVREIAPADLETFRERDPHRVYKVVFREEDMVAPIASEGVFDLQDYYDHPEKYRSQFERYVPHLTVLVNGIYWTERYPRLITKRYLTELFAQSDKPRLHVIGDVSCDEEGAIECNVRATDPGNPIYVYNPATGQTRDGYRGAGVVVLAVDNLPGELPRESSTSFSTALMPFVPEIAQADYDVPFEQCSLSPAIKNAVIAWRGQLAPDYEYIAQFMQRGA